MSWFVLDACNTLHNSLENFCGYIDSGNQYVDPGKLKSISRSCISPGKYTLAPGAFTNLQENEDLPLGSLLYVTD
jgi:hypothetical protein